MDIFVDKISGMPCYVTTPADLKAMQDEYEEKFSKSNLLNSNTVYDKKESRLAGILGEIVFRSIYGNKKEDKDITFDFNFEGYKVDVKCKYRSVPPLPIYEASFFSYQASKDFHVDYYYFMSTMKPFKYVWLCGYIKKEDILNNPHKEIWKPGEVDRSNGMTFRKETICLKYQYLNQITMPSLSGGEKTFG